MQITLQLCPRGVGCLDDAAACTAQLGRASLGHVTVPSRLLGLELLLDVGERRHRAASAGQLEGRGREGDAQDRAVLSHQPVLVFLQRLAGEPCPRHRAVLLGERRAVGVLVVDQLVAWLALELGEILVADRGQRGGIGVVEAAPVIDDPDRLCDRLEDRLALEQGQLRAPLLLHVGERHDGARAGRELDRRRGV